MATIVAQVEESLSRAPKCPGCYVMRDVSNVIIYVGKAKNIRNRVLSYFRGPLSQTPKTQVLVSKINSLEFLETQSEVEALLLENTLIKKHRPRYNIRLKDDKTYPYIWLDTTHDYPRAYFARKVQAEKGLYFGPYPNPSGIRQLLQLAAKAFLIRDCRDNDFANRSRPCLSYQIGQCTAPCVGHVSKESYQQQVEDFVMFLKGENEQLKNQWLQNMELASDAQNFEEAAKYRDRLKALDDLQKDQRVVDLNDRKSRDVWAYWPGDFFSRATTNTVDDIDLVLLQFREGKWWGRKHFPIILEDKDIDIEGLVSLISSYYLKSEIPSEVIMSSDLPLEEAQVLSELLRTTSLERASLPFEFEQVTRVSEGDRLWRLWDLALQNARSVGEEQKLLREKRRNGIEQLRRFLKLEEKLDHVECLDISNFQGQENVAACVVFRDGKKSTDDYRQYVVKSVQGQDDFGSLREIVRRRYGKGGDSPRPKLLIVDGGRAQLESVQMAMREVNVDFPVVGLAKSRTQSDFTSSEVVASSERFFLPGQKNPKVIKDLAVLRFVSEIRDEAHRFAITFHRKRRDRVE